MDAVLDLDEEEAAQARESGILGFNPYGVKKEESIRCITPDLQRPPLYQQIGLNGQKSEVETPPPEVEGEMGPEPELESGLRDDADLPLIPASTLIINHCQKVFEIQLLIQKLEPYTAASPKDQGNALYLATLRTLLERLKRHTMSKLEAKRVCGLQFRCTSVTVHPLI